VYYTSMTTRTTWVTTSGRPAKVGLRAMRHGSLHNSNSFSFLVDISSISERKNRIGGRNVVANVEAVQGTTTTQSALKSSRVSLFDAMKIFGPAPERINSRLAMFMFIPTAMREMETGETVLQQFANPSLKYILLCGLIVWASMIPILKGAKDEDFWIMRVSAEKVNGRVAMLGWAGLIALEELYAHGACFF